MNVYVLTVHVRTYDTVVRMYGDQYYFWTKLETRQLVVVLAPLISDIEYLLLGF